MLYECPQAPPEHFGCEAAAMTAHHLLAEHVCHLPKSVIESDEEIDAVGERFALNDNTFI